ncbi:MAG TPA: IclR family transcriptional regulator C-terminal domain-containing protein [Acidimicrobiales bacterium]|nr:IclR family transcriptional regulator C-terminal domain-containing protein [Acidimicrobiales bacterium]
MSGEGGRGDFVQSLERGLSVIKAFGPERRELTLAEVARATSLTRASARRFLLTLMDLGYVSSNGRTFSLRPRVLELGYAYLSTLSLNEVAAPHMEALVARVRESSSIAVLDGDDIAYVVRVPTKRIMAVTIAVGTRFPAYATSMGRVLLAHLPPAQLEAYLERVRLDPLTARTVTDRAVLRRLLGEVAAQGYALVDQELEDGLRSIAVPVVPPGGQPQAAINVSVHASRMTRDGLRRQVLPQLRETADLISRDLRAVAASPATAAR